MSLQSITRSARARLDPVEKKKRRSPWAPRIEFVLVTKGGTRMEYKSKENAAISEAQARGAAALILIGMGVKLPIEITEKDAKNA